MRYMGNMYRRVAISDVGELDSNSSGKWVLTGAEDYIGRLFKESRDLVRIGKLYETKYTRIKKGKYALLVYADRSTRKSVFKVIKENLSLNSFSFPIWISNDFTRKRRKVKNLLTKIRTLSF